MSNSTQNKDVNNSKPNGGKSNQKPGNQNNRGKSGGGRNKGSKSRNNGSKNMRRDEEIKGTVDREISSMTNDVSWYSNYPQLVKDVAQISFGKPLGLPFDLSNLSPARPSIANEPYTFIPGLCAIHFVPTIGISNDKTSAVNRCALRLYTNIRSQLRTNGNYDSQDMMMAVLAVDSAYMFHNWLKRLYGIAQLWTPTNRYYPTQLLYANGVNADDFTKGSTLVNLRSYINTFAADLGAYAIPGDFDIFKRHDWMVSGYYADSQTERAQTYMFVPDGFWQFNNTSQVGTQLDFKPLSDYANATFLTLDEIKNIGKDILRNLMGDEDMGDICGDLLNAFGPTMMRVPETIPDGYRVLPSYDATVLSQIENLDAVGEIPKNMVITQDPSINNGAILFQPKVTMLRSQESSALAGMGWYANYAALTQGGKLINFHHDSPSPGDVIEATRLSLRIKSPNQETKPKPSEMTGSIVESCGSEIVTYLQYIRLQNGGRNYDLVGTGLGPNAASANYNNVAAAMARISQFDWHPLMYVYAENGASSTTPLSSYSCLLDGVFGDLDYVGMLSPEDLYNINDVVMLSLFDTALYTAKVRNKY